MTRPENWLLPTELRVSLRQRASNDAIAHFGDGAVAFGYIALAAGRRLWDYDAAEQVTLSAAHDRVDGVETITVRITGPSDVRTLWLDPAQGMIPRQLAVESTQRKRGDASSPEFRQRIHAFRFDHAVSPSAITGFAVVTESQSSRQNPTQEDFTIDRRLDREEPTDLEFLNAIDLPDGTPVRVDGLGLNSHAWLDGRVVPTRKAGIP